MSTETVGNKPGWKTTEFWLIALTNLITIVGGLKDLIPDDTAAIVLAVLNGIYTVMRTIAKKPA